MHCKILSLQILWIASACTSHALCRPSTALYGHKRQGLIPTRGGGLYKRQQQVTLQQQQQQEPIPQGTASIPSEIFNLIKNIVGAGVLGLPAGIAAYGDAPLAIVPALVLTALIGFLSAYGFSTIALVCDKTRSTSYRQAWSRCVSPNTSWMPTLACLLVTAGSVLTFSMILADTIPVVLQAVAGISLSRTQALLGVTITTLLPLCLMKELSKLAPFSLLGILGMVYTAAVMVYRWLSHDYSDGTFVASSNLVPTFGTQVWSPNAVILMSMLATAFRAHYNAPKFFWELDNNTLARFNIVVASSFIGAGLLAAVIMVAGYSTFGAASSSMILNNYAIHDELVSLSRAAVAVSLICSYPLAFTGVREGLFDLLNVSSREQRDALFNLVTISILVLVTMGAFWLNDIGFILALGGATWGNCIVYLFPAYMLVQLARKMPHDEDLRQQVPLAVVSGLSGLVLALVGTTLVLSNQS